MLEAKYYKDYRHNYMILQSMREEVSRNYQYKILASGKIQEILKCSVRHVNGETYFYYDISSKTTLENYYQGKKLSYSQLKDLFRQLYGIYSRLGSFFMEETKFVLLPEAIFYDLTDQKYIGLYYPDYEPETENPYEVLMEYLLDHIDTEDQQLSDCMYRIYEMSEEAGFSMDDALRLLDRCERQEEKVIVDPGITDNGLDVIEFPSDNLSLSVEPETGTDEKKSLFYPVFAGLSVCGMAAVMIVYYLYELSSEEILILIGCSATMGVCLLICLTKIIKNRRKKSNEQLQEGKRPIAREQTESYETEKQFIPLENMFMEDMNLCVHEEKCSEESAEYGNTIFYDASQTTEYKLYALDKKNKKHIELQKFPCTIGKMAGCVDYILPDASVSRVHAKFDKKDNKILLTDLNSTNGTYKNGLQLLPQETTEIEPGDEIRFGNLNYCYR